MDDYDIDDIDNTRTRWLRAAAIGLGAVVLAVAAFGVGRWSAPASGGGHGTTVSSQSGPGPWRVENGVPVGYAHTPAGAVAAATNFVMVFDGPLVAQPERYRSAVDRMAVPSAEQNLRDDADKTTTSLQNAAGLVTYAKQGRSVVLRTIPLSYHTDEYSTDSAKVSLWAESVIAVDGVLALRETWTTVSCSVDWVAGDWKLRSIDAYSGGSSGPVPVVTQPSTESTALPPQLKDFKEYRPDVATG